MDQKINKIYYDSKSGFLSVNELYKKVKEVEPKVTITYIKEWLKKQEEYQIIRKSKKILYHPIISHDGEYQADIMFLDNAGNNNKQIGLITMIHVPTRYAYAYPISSRKTNQIMKGLNEFIEEAYEKDPLQNLTTDNELFNNREVTKLLKENKINHFIEQPYEHSKLAIINRFHRTIKALLQKYFISQDTDRWIDVYDDIIENYNNRVHSLFKKPPSKVTKADINKSNFELEYKGSDAVKEFRKYKIGDKVRYLLKRDKFEKGNKTYSKKVYEITAIEGFSFILKEIGTNKILKNKGGTVQDFRYHELLKVNEINEAPKINNLPKPRTKLQKKADNAQKKFNNEIFQNTTQAKLSAPTTSKAERKIIKSKYT